MLHYADGLPMRLMDADKATLEGLAALIRLQASARQGRDDSNEPTVIDC